jgi:hypothetical protein
MHRRFATGELNYIGMAFVADHGVQHLFDLLEVPKLLAFGAAGGVADGTAQVAVITNLYEREAGVLFVVGAEAAVVRASPFDGSVVDLRHLGALDENLATQAVVVDVVGDQDALGAVLGAAFKQVYIAILENGFGFNLAIAAGADGEGDVVEEVWTTFSHELLAITDWHYCIRLIRFILPISITPPIAIPSDTSAQIANPPPPPFRPALTAHIEDRKQIREATPTTKPRTIVAIVFTRSPPSLH